ncbi:hypothetical protein ACS0TY_022394 [Phlomoides rotata]
MEELALAALTLISLVASIFWIFTHYKSHTAAPPLPPGPRGLPILGYLPFLKVNLHLQFTQLAHKYGPIYRLWLGSKLCVVLTSPSLIKEVVRDQDSIFANRDPPAAAIAAHGGQDIFWSPNGTYWREMRKLFVRDMLSNKNLQASHALRVDEVRKFVRDLNTKIGEKMEIGEMIFLTEVNVIMAMLWGGKIEGEEREMLGGEVREKVTRFVDLLGRPNVSDFFPALEKFDVQGIAREMKSHVIPGIDEILDSLIEGRMKKERGRGEENRKKDFLEILLELKDHKLGDESSFGLFQIKAVLMDIIIGGTDTTATTVEWVMADLLSNPGAMTKVQQELTDIVGEHNIVEESHLSNLVYLDAVVKESFRMHPPLPLIVPRVPSKSTTLGGFLIPKGTKVFLNMWSVCMDPQLWKEPSKFVPDRFLNEHADIEYIGNNYQYLPFGSGRRVCPGLILADRMVMYLLATLLHSFEWRLPDGQGVDLSGKFGIVMRKSTPLYAIPYKRLSDLNLYA